MSLINQMLRDLEQRSTSGMETSLLNGLSASDLATHSVRSSFDHRALIFIVIAGFVGSGIVVYLSGSLQQTVSMEKTLALTPEKKIPVFSENTVPENTLIKKIPAIALSIEKPITEVIMKPDSVIAVDEKTVDVSTKEVTPEMIIPDTENSIEIIPVNAGQDINENIRKNIRPLTDKQQSELAFQRAIYMLGRNNEQSARQALEESLSFSPAHLRARETLAALLLNTGHVNEAASSLHEGLQLIPDAAPLAKLYARILIDQGDVVTAVAILERARPTVVSDLEYYALLAALYRQVESPAQAARIYQQILLKRPGMATWWMGLALAQDDMGENTLALNAFLRAQRAGGLGGEVLKYIQTRIAVLTPVTPVFVDAGYDLEEFEE